ncbi:MAG: hypothetical protein WBG92_17800 [Thiohalocapsa sp.]
MQAITSREYKLMLSTKRFAGDEEALRRAAANLWGDLAPILLPSAIAVSGTDDVTQKRRKVRFFDTAEHWVRANDYVLRERIDLDTDEREVTLKFRHVDRFISQDRDMKPADGFEPDMKFEEDIKPPFQAVYSFSSNVLVNEDTKIDSLKRINKIYPGLAASVDEFPDSEALSAVADFTAVERVIKGTSFQIRKEPAVSAACSLTVWYDAETSEQPIVAEFSFKYEDEKEDYTARMARRAYDAFSNIQAKLGPWIDKKSMTKTASVYALSKP